MGHQNPHNMGMYTNSGPPPVQQPPQNMMQHQPPLHQGQPQQQQNPPPNNHTQASLPSPLYPWMRSQFGKLGLFPNFSFIFILTLVDKKTAWESFYKTQVVTEFVKTSSAYKKINFLHALARHQQKCFFLIKSAEFSFKMRSKIHRTESEWRKIKLILCFRITCIGSSFEESESISDDNFYSLKVAYTSLIA